jgi:arsenate reductase-like glutaredoxin family protein
MRLKTNVLYYFTKGREFNATKGLLDRMGISFLPIQIHDRMIDKQFIEILLNYCENGFDDLLKPSKNKTIDGIVIDELKVSELISIIVDKKMEVLKPVLFLGMRKAEPYGKVLDKIVYDELTAFIPYEERELSKIYE